VTRPSSAVHPVPPATTANASAAADHPFGTGGESTVQGP
jgi:hypothetical protein